MANRGKGGAGRLVAPIIGVILGAIGGFILAPRSGKETREQLKNKMGFRTIILEDSINIKTTPEKIWDFFVHMDENYVAWHPEDHILFRWIKGKPLEEGTIDYFEEYIHGRIHKMETSYTRIIPYREIEFRPTHPILRIFLPKSTFTITPKDGYCTFTARNYFRLGPISLRSKLVKHRLELVKKHMIEEGENLKKLLESEK